jgi:hypothetical protein
VRDLSEAAMDDAQLEFCEMRLLRARSRCVDVPALRDRWLRELRREAPLCWEIDRERGAGVGSVGEEAAVPRDGEDAVLAGDDNDDAVVFPVIAGVVVVVAEAVVVASMMASA